MNVSEMNNKLKEIKKDVRAAAACQLDRYHVVNGSVLEDYVEFLINNASIIGDVDNELAYVPYTQYGDLILTKFLAGYSCMNSYVFSSSFSLGSVTIRYTMYKGGSAKGKYYEVEKCINAFVVIDSIVKLNYSIESETVTANDVLSEFKRVLSGIPIVCIVRNLKISDYLKANEYNDWSCLNNLADFFISNDFVECLETSESSSRLFLCENDCVNSDIHYLIAENKQISEESATNKNRVASRALLSF